MKAAGESLKVKFPLRWWQSWQRDRRIRRYSQNLILGLAMVDESLSRLGKNDFTLEVLSDDKRLRYQDIARYTLGEKWQPAQRMFHSN